MDQIYSVTEAKIKLYEIISRVHFRKEKFTITKKGKAVAVIAPCNEISGEVGGRLTPIQTTALP